jgi:hypothetical protein
MPQLHGCEALKSRPDPTMMFITNIEFDEVISIWEFLNNFYMYIEKDTFYIEELYSALKHETEGQEVRLISEIIIGLI